MLPGKPIFVATDVEEREGRKFGPSGFAWDGNAFHVIEGGKIASVPPGEVREAYWRIAGAQPVFASIGPGIAGAVMGGAALEVRARAAAREARQGSGFYLEVRDFKKPLWRFQSEDEGVLRQINELVSQVSEGRR